MGTLTKDIAKKQAAENYLQYFALCPDVQNKIPVEPDHVAELLWNTTVVFADNGPSGKLACVDIEANKIYIYQSGHEKRDRFSIAHEVGHLALHKYLFSLGEVDKKHYGYYESQADAYAGALLIPEAAVREVLSSVTGLLDNDEYRIGVVAEKFDVSIKATQIRLMDLRLIKAIDSACAVKDYEKDMETERLEWKTRMGGWTFLT